MKTDFNNAKILITGWSWSWGNELTKQLLENYSPKEIIIYSRWELSQVLMKRRFSENKIIKYVIWDVRECEKLNESCRWVDYLFHLAALKHVPICENEPWESVKTNIMWTENVISASINNWVKMVVDVSTDKACNPINVYWSCKSVWERLIIQANKKHTDTRFVCVRAWNVMWTRWSIIPYFKNLLKENKSFPITNKEMTRYFMTLKQAILLLFKACDNCYGWEIYVTKMSACRILDLAKVLSNNYWKEFKYHEIGVRPGEKIHEELISEFEALNTVEDENFRIHLPVEWYLNEKYKKYKKMSDKKYTSNDYLMNEYEIRDILNLWWFLND